MKSKIWRTKFTGSSDFIFIFTIDRVALYNSVQNKFYGYSSELCGNTEVYCSSGYSSIQFLLEKGVYA